MKDNAELEELENDKAMGAAVKADVEMIKTMVERIETEVGKNKSEAKNDKSEDGPKQGPSNENDSAALNVAEMSFLSSLLKPSTSKNTEAVVDPHEMDTVIINVEEIEADSKNFDEVEFAFQNADEEPDEPEVRKIVHFHKY